jgi:hypothetical protein
MFRRFDRLMPLLNFKLETLSLYGEIMSYSFFYKKPILKIPIKERWEIRDFKIKDVSKLIEKDKVSGYTNINGYTYGIPYNEQWEVRDFILKKK